jgi:phosphoribosyl 1,2-cyclic phosphodiesterase
MEVRFLGVRGSVPTPGPLTARTGGNTSSVEVRCGKQRIVLDAGTGIRRLGDELAREAETEMTLLLSHLHWDHVQGLPFFAPLYRPTTQLHVYGPASDGRSLTQALETQMSAPGFPVLWRDLPCQIAVTPLTGVESFWLEDVHVTCARLNHPGGVLGYRIEHRGRSLVYATDTEHYAVDDPKLVKLAQRADVLIYDAMYTDAEYGGEGGPARVGWGHSTWQAGVSLAARAEVKRLVLFHHDPARSDEAVDAIEREASAALPGTLAARESLRLCLRDGGKEQAA